MKTNILKILVITASVYIAPTQAAQMAFGDLVGSSYAFNGFENIGGSLYASNTPYIEGGISVVQIGDGNVWTQYNPPQSTFGLYSWYADGGNRGYESISLSNNAPINAISLYVGNGWHYNQLPSDSIYLNYELLNGSTVVLSGSVLEGTIPNEQISFIGGDFNRIYLSATIGQPSSPDSLSYQALQMDNIKIGNSINTVPEPASIVMLAMGLLCFSSSRRKKNQA